jgi:thioester reductase-like protein
MNYCLLTGATGLVGGYLLHYLLDAGVSIAVLVRATRNESAAARINAVMRRWEELGDCALRRPVVLEGNLCKPFLGLDRDSRRWIANHCDRVVHNGASMTFRENQRTGEPFRTNVDGVRNLLDVCQDAEIRQFHHVSTAYICGLRTGRVLETELDLGQENGNVYEKSKMVGEKLVRGADFLDQITIYRPTSVVGDSTSGFTNSTHGFYLPLQMAHAIADKFPVELMGERFFEMLGLNGNEGKNLVPVDWLGKAITSIVNRPEFHGRTYHLSSSKPVTVRMIQTVIQEAMARFCKRRASLSLSTEEIAGFEDLFRHYIDVYRSHWRDDPVFDRTNTDLALDHLPCPDLDHDTLLRIAKYPIEKDFILNDRHTAPADMQPYDRLDGLVMSGRQFSAATETFDAVVNLQITGPGGGQWRLLIRNGRVEGADLGLSLPNSAGLYLNSHTFASLARRQLSVEESINTGRLLVSEVDEKMLDLEDILQQVTSSEQNAQTNCTAETNRGHGSLPI